MCGVFWIIVSALVLFSDGLIAVNQLRVDQDKGQDQDPSLTINKNVKIIQFKSSLK